MEIKTKFNVGDEVFVQRADNPKSVEKRKIHDICIWCDEEEGLSIGYGFEEDSEDNGGYHESDVYGSPQEIGEKIIEDLEKEIDERKEAIRSAKAAYGLSR